MENIFYLGDNVPLYIKFMDDELNNCYVSDAKVRILHEKDGEIYEDLEWTDLVQISENEYIYNYTIPLDSDLGQYQIIYVGKNTDKEACKVDTINIINKNVNYINPIKIFGYVQNIKDFNNIQDVNVQIYDDNNQRVFTTKTNIDGYWESYIYPNKYNFLFQKVGFKDCSINVEINEEINEQQFETIGLYLLNDTRGNGTFKISESFKSKYGLPLVNLDINIYDILNPKTILAKDVTNEDGSFTCFLDEGVYILKAIGVSFSKDFNKTFKLKVDNDGSMILEDLSKNIAMLTNMEIISNGNGMLKITDNIMDKNGNGIIDVQVNALDLKGNLIAQDYTNVAGEWTLNLDPGQYIIEYYHPKFKVITEKRTIK